MMTLLIIAGTIVSLLLIATFFLVLAVLGIQYKLLLTVNALTILVNKFTIDQVSLIRTTVDLSLMLNNLGVIVHDLSHTIVDSSFKFIHDGERRFGGFSPEDIGELMNKNGHELTESDIDELKKLFGGLEDSIDNFDDEEDLDDNEPLSS